MNTSSGMVELWIGSSSTDASAGIGVVSFSPSTGFGEPAIAAVTGSPSFLARHPTLDVLYAVDEGRGLVRAFSVGPNRALTPLGSAREVGVDPCHLGVDPRGRYLITSCWGDGAVVLHDLEADGSLGTAHRTREAVIAGSSARSRAHASITLADGRIATTDLGIDLLRFWRYDRAVGLVPSGELKLPPGSGPRHLVQHSSGHLYVVTEYSIEVLVIGMGDSGEWSVLGRVPLDAAGASEGDAAAEISLDPSGERVRVSIRSSNRIVTLAVADGGVTLRVVSDVPSGGDWPRHHLDTGGTLFVANQRSGAVTAFDVDSGNGEPGRQTGRVTMSFPTCLIPHLGS